MIYITTRLYDNERIVAEGTRRNTSVPIFAYYSLMYGTL